MPETLGEILSRSIGAEAVQYLGDGAYVAHDGYHVWLITWDGIRVGNKIALDPHVRASLIRYIEEFETDGEPEIDEDDSDPWEEETDRLNDVADDEDVYGDLPDDDGFITGRDADHQWKYTGGG